MSDHPWAGYALALLNVLLTIWNSWSHRPVLVAVSATATLAAVVAVHWATRAKMLRKSR